MDIDEFKTNLGLTELPQELEKLIYFQTNNSDKEEYSDGFVVRIDKKGGLKSWSKDEKFLEKLLPFARANASGSFYTLWIYDNNKPLNQLPIVVFGDEGGVHIVAENILELLHLITYDVEIDVDEEDASFKKRKKKPSENLAKYLKWIKENYDLDRIEKPSTIIKKAQEKYQNSFDEWFNQYYDTKRDKTNNIKLHLRILSRTPNEKAIKYNIVQLKKIIKKSDDYKEVIRREMTIIQSDETKQRILKELKLE
jgi:hypothetical protein